MLKVVVSKQWTPKIVVLSRHCLDTTTFLGKNIARYARKCFRPLIRIPPTFTVWLRPCHACTLKDYYRKRIVKI